MSGFLYCLQNVCYTIFSANVYKLGMTKRETVEMRLSQHKTSIPYETKIIVQTNLPFSNSSSSISYFLHTHENFLHLLLLQCLEKGYSVTLFLEDTVKKTTICK